MPPVHGDSDLNWKDFFRFYWEMYKEFVVQIPFNIWCYWCYFATFGKGYDLVKRTLKEALKDA